ncbi:MAG: nucleotidyltransferase substrate binding protein [Candidatus Omnitrophica bacterium]|nr:nucleotidyltransferase substrate binding protein [Candidatus Omnitrophota bacterium]
MNDSKNIYEITQKKVLEAISLVESSLSDISPYNPEQSYTAKELEPYDALSDRFIRGVEISLKFFRTYEMYLYGENSETIRDLLNRMEKTELIESTYLWMEMRDIRNRIVHDYLPEQIKKIYDLIIDKFGKELSQLRSKIRDIHFE